MVDFLARSHKEWFDWDSAAGAHEVNIFGRAIKGNSVGCSSGFFCYMPRSAIQNNAELTAEVILSLSTHMEYNYLSFRDVSS